MSKGEIVYNNCYIFKTKNGLFIQLKTKDVFIPHGEYMITYLGNNKVKSVTDKRNNHRYYPKDNQIQ